MTTKTMACYTDAIASCAPPSGRPDSASKKNNDQATRPSHACVTEATAEPKAKRKKTRATRPSRACTTEAEAKPIKTKPAKGWSKERRAAQAARCKAQQPWRHSTGPKTARGKALSARNATRHGYRSKAWLAEVARCRKLFRLLKIYMRVLRSCAHKGFSPVPYICVLRRNLPSTSAVNHENISTHGD